MWSCECVSGTTVSQQSRNMSPRNVCRSFVLSVVFVLLFLESPINGFSIRRTPEQKELEIPVDLTAEESTLLEVKNDMKRPNDIKSFDIKREETLQKLVATENDKTKLEVSTFVGNGKSRIENAKIEKKINSKELNNIKSSFITTGHLNNNEKKTILNVTTTPILNTTETDIPKTKIKNEESKDILTTIYYPGTYFGSELSSRQTLIPTTDDDFIEMISYNTTPTIVKETNTDISELPFQTRSLNLKGVTRITENGISKKNTQSPELQVTSTPLKLHSNKTLYSEFSQGFDNNSNTLRFGMKDMSLTEEFNHSKGVSTGIHAKNNKSSSNEDIIIKTFTNFSLDPTHRATKTMSTILESTFNTREKISSTAQIDITNSDATTFSIPVNTDSTTADNLVSTELDSLKNNDLLRKKYTVIERKRPSTIEDVTPTTDYDTEMTRAETSQTRYIFDKSFSLPTLSSLEQIEADKMNFQNQLLHNKVILNPIQQPTENEISITASMPTGKIYHPRIGTVSSMRAGFLDYSGKASTPGTTLHENDQEIFGLMYESIDLGQINRLEHKNISIAGSQSQLPENEIKEELLKEEILNDQLENTKRSRGDRDDDNKDIKVYNVDVSSKADKQSSQLSKEGGISEDRLSVQPISHEQGKNMDLYVVSPNYKPMKRIEVQPAKSFVRDPDDNSWRNMSISSLGIVFKPKNSSKSFTQVLKNKTETELSSFIDKDSKTGLPDLRERLEKIAEVRKSKKKRVNKNGDTVYSDYEESNNSGESVTTIKVEDTSPVNSTEIVKVSTTRTPPTASSVIPEITQSIASEEEITKVTKENIFKFREHDTLTTQTPKNKFYNIAEYYDTTDEYDADYLTLSKIDIKKFTIPVTKTETTVTSPTPSLTKPLRLSDRKPTVEYFPPRVNPKILDYDNDFQKKINLDDLKDNTKPALEAFYGTSPTIATYEAKEEFDKTVKPIEFPLNRHEHINLNKNLYLTEIPHVTTALSGFDINDENFNRASYVIKHYRDFINAAAKDDDDKNTEYVALTEPPIRDSTLDKLAKLRTNRVKPPIDHNYDYDMQYRKNTLNRFVNNFNQNSEKYKVEFPILFNNSIDHRKYQANGNVLGTSNAFLKRLYSNPGTATKPNFAFVKPCDPNCDKLTVELSPAYELHYYVPEEEEKQVAELRPRTVSYRYRL